MKQNQVFKTLSVVCGVACVVEKQEAVTLRSAGHTSLHQGCPQFLAGSAGFTTPLLGEKTGHERGSDFPSWAGPWPPSLDTGLQSLAQVAITLEVM